MATKFRNKTVMVTGATGFIGNHLAQTLVKRDYNVIALVRSRKRAEHLEKQGVKLVEGNLIHSSDVEAAVQGVKTIYHIAALYRSAKYPDKIYKEVNVEGTRNIINAAEKFGVKRLVHCSTVGVHGDINSVPADEEATFAADDVYQRTKLEGELLVRKAIERGLPATIFRPVGVYGPGDMRFLKLFKSINRGWFRMLGSGKVLYHLIYIDDLIEGVLLCSEKPEAIGRTYILSGPRYTTIEELSKLIATVIGKELPKGKLPLAPLKLLAIICEVLYRPFGLEPPLYRRRLDFFYKNRAFTGTRAKSELGFKPNIDLEQGLAYTAKWYIENGYLNGKLPKRIKDKFNL